MRIERLRSHLEDLYRKKTPGSFKLYRRAGQSLVHGGSHTMRLWRPYPVFPVSASGAEVEDVDGNVYLDYWQGHYANILGHNPPVILKAMRRLLESGGLHTGFEGRVQIDLAEILLRQAGWPGDKVRFTTSGTLAAMYAVMMAKAFSGRDHILKIGGGWHGASPYLLKGVRHHRTRKFASAESAGVADDLLRRTHVTRFNDLDDLEHVFKTRGDKLACFIVEPFLGVGGFMPAERDYLQAARRLTERYGVVLIFDEVISGFRFGPSGVQSLYDVRPDLSLFGKLIGGGHAVAAVIGRSEIMEWCDDRPAPGGRRVLFEGGTFSGHTSYLKAGAVMLGHLAGHAERIYGRLSVKGDSLRTGIEKAFADEGFDVRCTGWGNAVVPGSSLFMVHFPRDGKTMKSPDDLLNDAVVDVRLREEILKLALLIQDVHIVHGGGAVSTAHGDRQIRKTVEAYADAAALFRKFLLD
jgi:glutamate-1-semialdehyde 2,1-aminomutase